MALIGQIVIAMSVQNQQLKQGLGKSAAMLGNFEAKVYQSASALKGLAMAAGAGGAAAALYKSVSAASSLGDAIQASKAMFGDASQYIVDQADKQAAAFGTSKRAYVEAASSFGAMMQGAGKSADESARLGVSIANLGQDLAALKGAKQEEVFTAIGAALRGEFDPIERFGIFLKADAIEAKALAMGLAKTKAELTDGAKKTAALAAIMEQSSKATGFFAANAGRASNLTDALWGRVENLTASLGEKLLPLATGILSELNVALGVISNAWTSMGNSAVSSAMSGIGATAQASQSMGFLQRAIGFVVDAWDVLRLGFSAAQSYITAGIGKLIGALGYLQDAILTVINKIPGLEVKGSDFFRTWSRDLDVLANQQWAGFQKQLMKPWPSEGINAMFADAQAKTAALQASLAKTPSALTSGATGAAAKKTSEVKFASAMSANSQDAVNTILRSRYGSGGPSKAADATAKNTAETAKAVKDLPSQIGRAVALAMGGGNPLMALGNF